MKQTDIRKAASLLGSLNKGKKKTLSKKESQRRRLWIAEVRKKRWPKKNEHSSKEQSD